MSTESLLYAVEEQIATVTLNRPERRNALSLALMNDLVALLDRIGGDREIHAVILAAAGPVFCSGHDLREMTGRSLAEYREIFSVCSDLMMRIHRIPQPVIACVHAMATAAGCQLVAACDLAVASEKAQFATPGVKIGLFCTTPMVELTRSIGRKRSLEMLLTGQPISAATAAEWGLVNRVVSPEALMDQTRDLARSIAQASSMTIGIGKRAFYAQIDSGQEKAYDYAKEVMSMNALASDAGEGISAFLEKRQPRWTGQ